MSQSSSSTPTGRVRGTVKFFKEKKGFGFIEPHDEIGDGDDVFVHFSEIEQEGFKTLNKGDEVSFEVERRPKGLNAMKVRKVVDGPDSSGDSGDPGSDSPPVHTYEDVPF